MRKLGCVGVYGERTRFLQRKLSFEAFGLTFKTAKVWLYEGDRTNTTDQNINNIGNTIFNEVPDRAYSDQPVEVPIGMEQMREGKADYSRFGFIDPVSNETQFRMHIDDFTDLGRELIVGDALEIPFHEKNGKKAIWEVTDVDLSQEKEKFIAIIYAQPIEKSRSTTEIPIDRGTDESLLQDIDDNLEDQVSADVPSEEETFNPPATEEEVDYRDEGTSSFLDDPNQEF